MLLLSSSSLSSSSVSLLVGRGRYTKPSISLSLLSSSSSLRMGWIQQRKQQQRQQQQEQHRTISITRLSCFIPRTIQEPIRQYPYQYPKQRPYQRSILPGGRRCHYYSHDSDSDYYYDNINRRRIILRLTPRSPLPPPPPPLSLPFISTITTTRTSLFSSSSSSSLSSTSASSFVEEVEQQQPQPQPELPVVEENVTERILYQELVSIATEIRYQDDLYYNTPKPTSTTKESSQQQQPHDSSTAEEVRSISDEMYDLLVQREEVICRSYPHLMIRYQQESGFGPRATRYGGRVGPIVTTTTTTTLINNNVETTTTTNDDADPVVGDSSSSTSSTEQQQQRRQQQQIQQQSLVVSSSSSIRRKHMIPMLSLDNVNTEEQLVLWIQRILGLLRKKLLQSLSDPNNTTVLTIITEPKLDGVSLCIRYTKVVVENLNETTTVTTTTEDDKRRNDDKNDDDDRDVPYEMEWACTRGDGKIGTDVTKTVVQAKLVPNLIRIPKSLLQHHTIPSSFEVRGEVVLPRTDFETIQQQIQQQQQIENNNTISNNNKTTTTSLALPFFSNPRNAASGLLQRKYDDDNEDERSREERIALQSKLRFYGYDIILGNNSSSNNNNNSNDDDDSDAGISTTNVGFSNYLEMRNFLQLINITIPQPFTTTTILLDNTTTATATTTTDPTTNETTTTTESSLPDLSNLLQYHEKLRVHRLRQETQQQKVPTSSSSKSTRNNNTIKDNTDDDDYIWDDYDVDGCVHKICQIPFRDMVGSSNRAPRWAVAHKFPSAMSLTSLVGIELQVGRTGVLTPVAVLQPVVLNGVTISRATLHNVIQMQQLLLPEATLMSTVNNDHNNNNPVVPVGTPVLVRRAGDVIPQVVSRATFHTTDTNSSSSSMMISLKVPTHCPACGSPVAFMESTTNNKKKNSVSKKKKKSKKNNNNESTDEETLVVADDNNNGLDITDDEIATPTGRILRCTGPPLLCPPQAVGALQQCFSRAGLDVSGLSAARIKQLHDENILKMPYDLFELFLNLDEESTTLSTTNNAPSNTTNSSETVVIPMTKLDRITKLEGWGPKSVANLEGIVRKISHDGVSLSRFINSLNIRSVGVHSSAQLAVVYESVHAFLQDLETVSTSSTCNKEAADPNDYTTTKTNVIEERGYFPRLRDENDDTKGIGPTILSSLYEFAQQRELVEAAKKLSRYVPVHNDTTRQQRDSQSNQQQQQQPTGSLPFQGLNVVFTGTVAPGMTREQAQNEAKVLGALATPSRITKSTNLLVVGVGDGSSVTNTKKLEQARSWGIRIIDSTEFLAILEEFGTKRQS